MKNTSLEPEAHENSLLKNLITLEKEVSELEAKVKAAATWRHALRPLQEATAAKKRGGCKNTQTTGEQNHTIGNRSTKTSSAT